MKMHNTRELLSMLGIIPINIETGRVDVQRAANHAVQPTVKNASLFRYAPSRNAFDGRLMAVVMCVKTLTQYPCSYEVCE